MIHKVFFIGVHRARISVTQKEGNHANIVHACLAHLRVYWLERVSQEFCILKAVFFFFSFFMCVCFFLWGYKRNRVLMCLYVYWPLQPSCTPERCESAQIRWRGWGGQRWGAGAEADQLRGLSGRELVIIHSLSTLVFQWHQSHNRDTVLFC